MAANPSHNSDAGSPRRLFLIDGYSNIFRAFYAIRNLSNSRGEPTNAVYGFVQMLRKLLRDENPELVGVALDVSRKTVRSERYEDYKANRAPMPEDLKPQIPYIRRALEAYRIPILELPNYEADDVLGTLARKAAEEGYQVVLVSADKDLMQLVTPRVLLYHTGRDKLYDPALVEEDFGVPPEKVVDVLALMGDTSDNVPGVPGIGAKGARQLVHEFGSLEALLERAGEVKRKSYREGLEEHRESALMSKELVTIHTDLEVPFDALALRHDPPDPAALRRLFTELEFTSLVHELEATAGDSGDAAPAAEEITEPGEWERLTAALGPRLVVAVVGEEEPLGLAVAALAEGGGSEEGSAALFADFRRQGMAAARESLERWLGDGGITLVGHDLKEVLRLSPRGPQCRARLEDAMLLSYLLRPALNHGLEDLALERLGIQPLAAKEAGWSKGHRPPPGDERLLAYAGERAALVRRLVPAMRGELGEAGALAKIYRDIEAPLIPVLLGMEEAGVLLDVPFLQSMSAELGEELEGLEAEIHELAGEPFNINSPQQLGGILFEKLQYPVLKRTKKTKSYSTGADVLEELAHRGYPLPERLLRYRELAKLKSTYVDALPALVAADGRVHTRFNQAVAATGRLSSTNPNLQNIPVRTELGQRIRRAFIAPEGRALLVADYSQIELRVLAHIAGEEALLEAFRAGLDIHAATAASVFGGVPDLVTADQRRAAKVINFGIIYGMSPFGLSRNLGISTKEAESFIEAYMERYPGVRRYMEETLATAEAEGKVETLYGRARWLPDVHSKNRNLRENARRMAINARIQGTAADLMKLALIALRGALAAERPASRLLLTVHDEVVLEVPAGDAEAVAALVRREMEGVADLDAPLVVDAGWGRSWYDAKS